MIDIDLELQDVKSKEIIHNRITLELTSVAGEKIIMYLSATDGERIHDELERVCVAEEYQYENMEKQLAEARDRIDELEEILTNLGYQEAV
jgi:TolA-binding protein